MQTLRQLITDNFITNKKESIVIEHARKNYMFSYGNLIFLDIHKNSLNPKDHPDLLQAAMYVAGQLVDIEEVEADLLRRQSVAYVYHERNFIYKGSARTPDQDHPDGYYRQANLYIDLDIPVKFIRVH